MTVKARACSKEGFGDLNRKLPRHARTPHRPLIAPKTSRFRGLIAKSFHISIEALWILGGAHRKLIAPPLIAMECAVLGGLIAFFFICLKADTMPGGGASSEAHRRPLIDPSSLQKNAKMHICTFFCGIPEFLDLAGNWWMCVLGPRFVKIDLLIPNKPLNESECSDGSMCETGTQGSIKI